MKNSFATIAKKHLSGENYAKWLSQIRTGDELKKKGKIAAAISCYKKAANIYPKDFYSLFVWGRLEIRRENYRKSIECFDKCLSIKKNDTPSLYWKAFSYFESRELKLAYPIYEKVVNLDKKYIAAWHDLGHCYLSFGKYKIAEECLKNEIKLGSASSHTLTLYGDSLFFQKRYLEAIKNYEIAIKKDPERLDTNSSLGGALYNISRFSNAIEYLEKALEIKPTHDYSLHILGHCYSELGRHTNAIDCFKKELATRNFANDTWYEIGNSYCELKQYDKALLALKRSLKIDKDDIATWLKMGETYTGLKQYSKSAECFQNAEMLKKKKPSKKKAVKEYKKNVPLPKDNNKVSETEGKTKKVFVVHGHDTRTLQILKNFLENDLKLLPLVLAELPPRGRYLMEKIEDYLSESGFVVVLLTPDDIGYPKSKLDEDEYRARQNVVLEYGLSRGKLGRENVCLLYKGKVELPTDILGVNYIEMDKKGKWKMMLVKDLRESNMQVTIV